MTTYIPYLTLPTEVFVRPAISIMLPVLAGTAIGYATRPQTNSMYISLKQPPGRPPPYVFGPVWTALYAGMGYAAYRAWIVGMTTSDMETMLRAKQGATLYTIQLGLNLIWMPLYFGMGRPVEATADIVALTGVVGYLSFVWSKVDETASWMMAPYLAWLGFATYLSAGSGYLNNWDFNDTDRRKKN